MKSLFFIIIGLFLHGLLLASNDLSPIEILKKVDQNLTSRNIFSINSFIIHGLRGTRKIKAQSWIQGTEKSFSEYLFPAREKGTKMLKIGKNLWIYHPQADRTIKISGHMLRQSVMGSDLSYEDMVENRKLTEDYEANIETETLFGKRNCWIINLKAKQKDVAYQIRKIWVDKERFITLRDESYTKRGKLLKIIELREVRQIKERWYPRIIWLKDALKQGKGTEIIIHEIQFDVNIPSSYFSKAALRR